MSLEDIVRPFQSPKPLGTRRVIATSTKLPTQTTHLAWGKADTLPVPVETPALQPADGVNFTVKLVPIEKIHQVTEETSRTIEKVKVQQEDNPDNFVVIERVKSITFGNTKKEPVLVNAEEDDITQYFQAPEGDPSSEININRAKTIRQALYYRQLARTRNTQIQNRTWNFATPPPGPNDSPVE